MSVSLTLIAVKQNWRFQSLTTLTSNKQGLGKKVTLAIPLHISISPTPYAWSGWVLRFASGGIGGRQACPSPQIDRKRLQKQGKMFISISVTVSPFPCAFGQMSARLARFLRALFYSPPPKLTAASGNDE